MTGEMIFFYNIKWLVSDMRKIPWNEIDNEFIYLGWLMRVKILENHSQRLSSMFRKSQFI